MDKNVIKIIAAFICTISFSLGGYFLVKYGKNDIFTQKINYKESGTADYEVCLKDNEFITDKCLTSSSAENTYIASLIDYLNLNYNYNIKFDENFSGSYKYYFKGVVKADTDDEAGEGNYYTKEYELTEAKEETFTNVKNINISDAIQVNYNEYNDVLNRFKDSYSLIMDGKLVVSIEIEFMFTNDNLGRYVSKEVSIPVTIPLTSQVVEIPITSSKINNTKLIYSNDVVDDSKNSKEFKMAGYACFGMSALFICLLIALGVKYVVKVSEYNKKLKKILRLYDSIIVNASKIPKLDKDNMILVESFEELIDAHSEVRKPINYVSSKKGSIFYLMSEGSIWVYTLLRDKEDGMIDNEIKKEAKNKVKK